jgi:hypothetical protein
MLITRTSSAVDYIVTDIFLGRVNVKFSNGLWYRYTNVSRRAILNLELNPNMSLGFWVNDNIINSARVKQSFKVNWRSPDSYTEGIRSLSVALISYVH